LFPFPARVKGPWSWNPVELERQTKWAEELGCGQTLDTPHYLNRGTTYGIVRVKWEESIRPRAYLAGSWARDCLAD